MRCPYPWLVLALCGLPAAALADGDPANDDVVSLFPYTGTLEKDGVGLSEELQIKFTLYDGSSANPDAPIWYETQTVQVYHGRFTALLGLCDQNPAASACPLQDPDAASIADVIRNADDLQLGVELYPDQVPVLLQSRKRFLPVPYAVWTRAASDLQVARDLAVGRNATVSGTSSLTGDVSMGRDLTVTRNVQVNGALSASGNLSSGGVVQGAQLKGRVIGQYSTTHQAGPRGCVLTCKDLGGHLATYDELFSVAAAGEGWCQYNWFVHPSYTEMPCKGYPMYDNVTAANSCGRLSTGDRPRIEGTNCNYDWDSAESHSCACSLIK
ncbi:MAG: hypothetical protein ABIJ09_07390 [Pseudomonadota bacterium]